MAIIIKHFSHKHLLGLSEKEKEDMVLCNVCMNDCVGLIYSCWNSSCRFNLDQSCLKLPQELDNPLLHPHPLSLQLPQYRWYDNKCNACRNFCWGFTFRCDKSECKYFNLDVKCAFIRPAAIEEGEEGTHHFSDHEHPLLLWENIPAHRIYCRECGGYCSDPKTYGCLPCGFFLHPSCFKFPKKIVHPFHPYHGPLTRKRIWDRQRKLCNACHQDIHDNLAYFCEKRDFNLHVECAFIRPAAIEEGEEEAEAVVGIRHFSDHEHPLRVLQNIPANRVHCSVCGKYCSDPKTYGCHPCGFFLHPSCFKFPKKIVHPFHPYHGPLTRERIWDRQCKLCNACHQDIHDNLAYFCEKRDFNLDVECALIRPAAIEEGEEAEAVVVGTHHEHPLLLLQNIPADRIRCRVCGKYCPNPMSYGCLPCRFFLHPSCCLNLQEEIFHPFHQNHPLTLKPIKDPLTLKRSKDCIKCNACRNRILGCFAYFCEHCNKMKTSFYLDIECASVIMPAITYEGHDHLLQFKEIIDLRNKLHCNACNKSSNESYAFSCLDLDCGFDLHHTCGPLPYTIKHKSHVTHPLILTSSPLEDEEDCEPDEFYCDACEEQIVDSFLPIYYCKECQFVAEVKCVISEVCSSLIGEYRDVELRNPLGQFGKVITKDAAKEMMQKKDQKQLEPTLTWHDNLCTLSEDEKKEKNLLTDRIKKTTTAEKIEAYDHEEIIMFSDKAYTQFMKFLNHSGFSNDKIRYPWDLSDRENKEAVVNVGDYMTTRKLAPILNHLLSNHGDIGAQSTLSTPKFKSLYLCMLCKCIDHMRNTMVVDITHDILLEWWTCLKILRLEGFQIDFAFDRLKRVTHAHFGLYVVKEVDDALDQLEKLKRKVKRIKSAKSSLIEECLREASVLKKGKAVTYSLL